MNDTKTSKRKDKPTPKRPTNPVVTSPPPENWREARKRKRELNKGLNKTDKREIKALAKEQRQKQYELMKQGDPRALPDKDKGPERKIARDYVDSRRLIANLFFPLGISMIIVTLFTSNNTYIAKMISEILMAVVLIWILFTAIESIFTGKNIMKLVKERYPNSQEKTFSIAFYATSRALKFRKMRIPLPQVKIGEKI